MKSVFLFSMTSDVEAAQISTAKNDKFAIILPHKKVPTNTYYFYHDFKTSA